MWGDIVGLEWMNDTTVSREMFPTKDSDTQGVIIINGVVVTVLKYASGVGIVVTTWMVEGQGLG